MTGGVNMVMNIIAAVLTLLAVAGVFAAVSEREWRSIQYYRLFRW